MKVSVIIPTHNEEKVIGECLESLKLQSYKDMEVVVVDDGSTDNSKVKIQKSKFKSQNFRFLKQSHKGVGAARNLGSEKASGEILVFVDADMTFAENFITKLVQPIIDQKTVGTFSKEEYLANKDNVWARCWNINRGLPLDRMLPKNYPDKQKVFRAIKKSAFEGVGGFDEQAGYTDDYSLSDKLGVKAVAAPGAKFYHKNPDSLKEVFIQSRWVAKRKYKLGIVGSGIALVRVFLPLSLILGLILATYHLLPKFVIFKLISDFGQFVGVLEYMLLGKVAK
ncbi:hypothetical protein A3F62_03950 [Candidatus Woesebacteria bacterium RIFCSPHIGHO2_12_FULL_44_11]|uniref:Glycosyltransferase 2-like domain-containing protein n=1 Tax=Candidatus Woesebacteria bacterium RIFCSPLOWO2_01_FULL_44_14 TaxID=1802525 RepID=A0A1F8C386_9BACT|nr:MAG: hypothetical protein A3F62_03950 [Candidatus Woesebacteria bacterium RIFCSPHIGHO2_12_FULL_44_11]OGM70767.1 MAG: hypothetical protein A2975_02660 [Candidatus Woesebacteria bacterium RIFCSPLOWO2_01_FULL_44_14]